MGFCENPTSQETFSEYDVAPLVDTVTAVGTKKLVPAEFEGDPLGLA